MAKSPAVTVMWDYTTPYAKFVDYTKRKEAVKPEDPTKERLIEGIDQVTAKEIAAKVPEQTLDYVGYINYMKRGYATKNDSKELTGIFTDKTLNASTKEAEQLKNMLVQAKKNKSLLWRGVISFDNDFLIQNGLYFPKNGEIDQVSIKKAVQKAMENVIKREKLSSSAFWWGNIHLNTDNIHVHVGLSEIKSARPTFFYAERNRRERKGKFSQKTIKGIKSNIYNTLVKEDIRSVRLEKEKEIASLRDKLLRTMENSEMDKLGHLDQFFVDQILEHLPKRKKLRYGSNARDFKISKFFIDRYVDHQLQNNILAYKHYWNLTESLLDNYRYAYNSGDKKAKNRIYQEVTHLYGKEVAKLLKTKSNLEFLDKRDQDLRDRLGNRVLRYIQVIRKSKNKSNIKELSVGNQKRVSQCDKEATKVHSVELWKRMGYKIVKGAIAIPLIVPEPKENMSDDMQRRNSGKNNFFKEVNFYDVRFVEPIDSTKVKIDIDFKALMSMKKDDLLKLVEISQNTSKNEPNNKMVRQKVGIYKYALRQKILEERKKEIEITLSLLGKYDKAIKVDKAFLKYKQKQLSEIKELIELQQIPSYQLSNEQTQKREWLQTKYADVVQVPIKKVDQEMLEQQTKMFKEEIQLVKEVQDQSIFVVLKGEETKDSYIEELLLKDKVIRLKWRINENNDAIKQLNDLLLQGKYRKANGKHFEELKRLYRELSPDKARVAEIQLKWDYQHDHSFREKISNQMEQRRNVHKSSYRRVSHKLVKGLSMALRDDSNERERLLRQLEREDMKEQEDIER